MKPLSKPILAEKIQTIQDATKYLKGQVDG